VLPPLLICFFGLFIGTIQAFVFTMLTLVYISVQVK
jgi:F-type H+-transporting ATPase subunit a